MYKVKKIELIHKQFKLYWRYLGNFKAYIYDDLYVFDNSEQKIDDFYETIKVLLIKDIPNNVHFRIINIFSYRIENSLHRLPFPFTSIE